MDERIKVWREAMMDQNHPRHKAAWVLFAPMSSAKAAARVLQDQSFDVTPWLLEVLDTEVLYDASSLGKGGAPVRAVGILGEWQITEAMPHLLRILETYDWEDDIFDETIGALQAMGNPALDPVLELAERADASLRVDLTAIVCRVGTSDERAFKFVQRVFEDERDDVLKSFAAGNLYELDPERAQPYFQTYLRNNKVGPRTREAIDSPRPLQRS